MLDFSKFFELKFKHYSFTINKRSQLKCYKKRKTTKFTKEKVKNERIENKWNEKARKKTNVYVFHYSKKWRNSSATEAKLIAIEANFDYY